MLRKTASTFKFLCGCEKKHRLLQILPFARTFLKNVTYTGYRHLFITYTKKAQRALRQGLFYFDAIV